MLNKSHNLKVTKQNSFTLFVGYIKLGCFTTFLLFFMVSEKSIITTASIILLLKVSDLKTIAAVAVTTAVA